MLTFDQPAADPVPAAVPASSAAAVVNYDRAPSLVEPIAIEPPPADIVDGVRISPIPPIKFLSFEDALKSYQASGRTDISLKRFWFDRTNSKARRHKKTLSLGA